MNWYTPGPWKWDRHILNSDWNTSDRSKMDNESVVMMLSSSAKSHLKPFDAMLIETAPEMYEVLSTMLAELHSPISHEDASVMLHDFENLIGTVLIDLDAARAAMESADGSEMAWPSGEGI